MLCFCEYLQVFGVIITFVVIDMMDFFSREKKSPYFILSNNDMEWVQTLLISSWVWWRGTTVVVATPPYTRTEFRTATYCSIPVYVSYYTLSLNLYTDFFSSLCSFLELPYVTIHGNLTYKKRSQVDCDHRVPGLLLHFPNTALEGSIEEARFITWE